tara:strand:+ start:963 stop:2126 length:1164 start_codon:yes stop_codon:yes gene_type:complete
MKKEVINIHNWNKSPINRKSFQEIESLFPSCRLKKGSGPVSNLSTRNDSVEEIEFIDAAGKTRSIKSMLEETYTDAFLVLKDGILVYEEYANGMLPNSFHLLNSISKTFLGMLVGILKNLELIDINKKVSEYIPEFKDTAFSETTVQHALDMAGAVRYGEDYTDLQADFWKESSVVGWRPDLVQKDSPKSLLEYALSLEEREQEDGKKFHYRTVFTSVISLVLERSSGQKLQDLLETHLWQKLGPEQDAVVVVDPTGFPYMGAGMNTCARDLARFGQMILNNGYFNNQQIVPKEWIRTTRNGSEEHKKIFAESDYGPMMPGGHYMNQVWVENPEEGSILCLGIYGQTIYINQANKVVIVKFSTHPGPEDDLLWINQRKGISAISASL